MTAVAAACRRTGRDPATVHLIAVSKFQPISAIEEAYRAGQRDFGESYVQELERKRKALSHLTDIKWHLIGHLQTNKVKSALPLANFFHALDSERLANEISKRSASDTPWPVFIEVNIDNEQSKSGIPSTRATDLAAAILKAPALRLWGLMCIPAPDADPRGSFRKMAILAEAIEAAHAGLSLQLSMGMSDDFEIAVEEGANWIRVGTKLFGERPQKR